MKDGLYIVNQHNICAAFIIEDGEVTICAPILRRKLSYWKKVAKWYPLDTGTTKCGELFAKKGLTTPGRVVKNPTNDTAESLPQGIQTEK